MGLFDELDIPRDSHFSRLNLPYGAFAPPAGEFRIGVAIGTHIVDLAAIEAAGLLPNVDNREPLFNQRTLNAFMAQGKPVWDAVRERLQELLDSPSSPLRQPSWRRHAIHRQADCRLHLPVDIGDYTDFYSSREHASNVGAMFRGPDQALLPNWLHLPIAYHGRASSIVLSGTPIVRPAGQVMDGEAPVLAPTREFDFELELGYFVGPGNPRGQAIPIDEAPNHIFGAVLVNDWSARDIQRWEYRPLGPFLGKNFATSISPWVVPLAALEPFRCASPRQEPPPLPYLHLAGEWGFDIQLDVQLQSAAMAAGGLPPSTISRTNARALYWTMPQQVAHHSVNGCPLRPGDLLATGTISGAERATYGSLLELAWGGRQPLSLPNGEQRTFLEDGDTLTLTGWCQGDGYRVGFGDVSGTVIPATPLSR